MIGLPLRLLELATDQGRAVALADKAAGRRTLCPYDLFDPSITQRRMGRAWMDAYLIILPIPDYHETSPD